MIIHSSKVVIKKFDVTWPLPVLNFWFSHKVKLLLTAVWQKRNCYVQSWFVSFHHRWLYLSLILLVRFGFLVYKFGVVKKHSNMIYVILTFLANYYKKLLIKGVYKTYIIIYHFSCHICLKNYKQFMRTCLQLPKFLIFKLFQLLKPKTLFNINFFVIYLVYF